MGGVVEKQCCLTINRTTQDHQESIVEKVGLKVRGFGYRQRLTLRQNDQEMNSKKSRQLVF